MSNGQEENEELRKMLWFSHGCPFAALYGDDGEMQCNDNRCRLDFKRQPFKELLASVLIRHAEDRAAKAQQIEALQKQVVEFERIGRRFQADSQKFFEQSCRNLERAETVRK